MNVGCDIVDIQRLSDTIDRRAGFLERVFTAREIDDARRGDVDPGSRVERARLAARFAAKEATRKALGDLRLPFHATEVRTGDDGAPRLYLHGEPATTLDVSLSHDAGMAMAFVVGAAPRREVVRVPDVSPAAPAERAQPAAGRVSLEL
jgi:holo-[acyl-carrier protein] synthase